MALTAKVIRMDERRAEGPQLEDGFVRVANELDDALLSKIRTFRHSQVVRAIIRKTYGFGKKEDDISLSQIAEMTGLQRSHVSVSLRELEQMRIINPIRPGKFGQIIGLNKHHEQWFICAPKQEQVTETVTLVDVTETVNKCSQNSNECVTETVNKTIQNRNNKRQLQKTTPKESRKPAAQDLPSAPQWIDEKAWADFVEHRKQIKHPLTSLAAKRVIDKLGQLRTDGYCPSKLIDIAIRNGWRDVFPRDEAKAANTPSEKPKWMEGVL